MFPYVSVVGHEQHDCRLFSTVKIKIVIVVFSPVNVNSSENVVLVKYCSFSLSDVEQEMIKADCEDKNRINSTPHGNESKEVADLIIDNKRAYASVECNGDVANGYGVSENTTSMGHKGHYQRVLLKNNVTQDLRTQSLPNCLVDDKSKLVDDLDTVDSCDIHNKLLVESGSPPQSPWFKTWPERCDKVKNNENSTLNATSNSSQNTQVKLKNCDIVENGNIKNKLTLSEALQNISLAYSPVTKQLHLVEKPTDNADIRLENTSDKYGDTSASLVHNEAKKGHKRNEAGSFSSTISSLSDPSPSRSLLDVDDKSLNSFDDCGEPGRKKSLTNFFNR